MAQEQLREDRADNANDRVGYDTELRLYSDKEIVIRIAVGLTAEGFDFVVDAFQFSWHYTSKPGR